MGPMRRIVTIKRSGVDGPHFPLSLSTCLFGRGIECDIRIQLPVVSKQHCKIEINEQEAVLHNFSSTNPTQVNGSVIDEPVQLKHGDVITIIDRSFRYENESLQKRSKSTEFPRKIHGQEPARRVSRSSFSSNPDGKAPDSKAYSKITEGKVSGSPQVHINTVKEDSTADDSEDSIAQETSDVHSSEHAGRNGRNAAHRISGDFREISRVKLMSHCGELKSPSTTQCLDDSQKNESPFRKLYQSMKKELDVKSQKENLPQYRRKSGLQTDYTTEKENADGLQQETQLLFSRKSRPKSGGSSHAMAEPASPERELAQAKGKGRDVESVQTPSKAVGASSPLYEPAQMKTPEQYPQQQNSPEKHKNKHLYTIGRRESVNPRKNEGFEAGDKTLTPRKLSAGNRTPAKAEDAADSAAKPGNLSSKTRGSIPADVEVLPRETEIQNDPFLTLWLTEVERKIQKDSLHKPEKVGATTGQMCPELPGLSAVDISNCGDSLNKSEGIPLKRRRVSFGGHLRPELFDENLPPNTPLKRGETPTKRKSLVVHTPPVLKKIIKEQPQPSAEQQSTSEIHLEVTAQSLVTGPPAPSPRKTPVANDRRSCQAAPASSSKSQTEVSKRGGRKSGNLPSKRASLRRSQHGILQMICSKRRSGASEANLIVAKSWADVVKLGAKQTQTKVVKHGPQRSVIKRQRRPATPKKPAGNVHSQFSTGHANSPCTIIIGKAYTEKVHLPAQPCRMFNNFISNQKRDFKEDLSGIAEMFKTPVKEQPQLTSTCHIAISNSENLLGKKVQVTNSGEEPLLPTSESFGGNAFFSARKAAKELSDRCSVSPALTRPSIRENGNTAETPRNTYKMTSVEMKTSDTETEPSKTVSSANKLRRSTELRNVQKLPEESKSEGTNTGVADHIIGRCQKTTPLQRKRGGEMKEIERPFETYKENIELKENVEKMEAVKRSRRTWGQKAERVSDLTDLKSLPDTERTKDLAHGQELLQTQDHAKAPESEKGKITKMPCKSLQPEPIDTPTRMKQWPKTSLGKVGVKEEPLAAGKLTRTPGETTHTHTEPAGDGRSIRTFKESPRQILNPVAYVTGMKRWPRTPKEEAQSLEDLAGFKELFQTPGHTEESMTDDKTTNIPSKSPPPESVDTPTSTKQRPKRSLRKADIEEELLALRKLTPSAGKAMHTPKPAAGNEKDIKALMRTPVQKLDLIGNLPGSKRQQQTPKEKAQALEDLAGFKELFQTPGHTEESVAAGKSTKIRCKSLQPDPVDTPTSTKQRLKRSLRKADIEEEFLALRKLTPSAGKAMHTPKPAVGEEKDINTFVGTPVQKLDLPDNLIGSKRRPQTPKEKAQALEDLAGFKELFKTPGHPEEAVAAGKTTKMPRKSSPPESADTPTSIRRRPKTPLGERDIEKELLALKRLTQASGETTHTDKAPGGEDTGIKAFKETAKQKLDSAASVTGSKKQPRTPKRKAQSLGDLTGSKELFQIQVCTDKPTTDENTTEIVCKSPQPDPVDTPTSFQAESKRSLRKADVEEFSALRKRTSSAGKATHTPKPAVDDEENINAVAGTPVQKLDLPENLTGSKRRPQTPKEKAQAVEDLAGLKELFQTPGHPEESMTYEKPARIACKSSQPDPDKTPASSKRWLRTSLGKVGEKEELLAVGKITQMPVGTTHTHTEPTGDGKSIRAVKESPKQILDPAASLTGSKRQPKNSKEKAEVPEDLVGFKELFQTPGHTKESMTNEITTKILYSSSPPDPVDIPTSSKPQPKRSLRKADAEEEFLAFRKLTPSAGKATHTPKPAGSEEKDINALMRTPVQKLDLPGNLPGSRRRPQTPKEKAQALEDLTGFKELFQTPCTDNPTTDKKTTKIPCKSPQPNPVDTPTSTKQRPKRSLRKTDIEKEFSALRKLTPLGGKVMHTPKPAVGEDKDSTFVGTPVQKPDVPGNLPRSKRRPQTPKERAQAHALEELAGFRELFQTPDHTEESTATDKITKVSCKSPQPDPVKTPTSSKRRLKTSLGKASVKEEVLAVVKLTQTSGETTHTHRGPARNGKSIRAFKESAKQMLDSADYVTGMKRWPRTPKEEAQSLEDLAGFKELFQTPGHTEESKTDDKTTNIPCKSPPESVDTPTSTRRQPKTPLGKRNVVEELSALKRLTQTPGGTTHTDKAPGDADTGIKVFKETAKQKLDPAASVTGSKKQPRTPKRKAQSLEDLTGLKELFQTPVVTDKPRTNEKTTKIACKSPQSDPADTPTSFQAQPKRSLRKADIEEEFLTLRKTSAGKAMHLPKPAADAEKDIKALMGTPVQKVDLPGNLPGSKRRPQTPKEKAQALEDLAGFKELFQTPGMDKPTTDEKTTKIGCKSPQPDPVDTPRSTIQRPKRSLRKAEVEEEFLALRKLTPLAGKAMHTPKPAVSDEKNRNTFVETPVQKLDLPGNLPGSKRRPQTPKEKAEALEDLAGFKELFQTPDHTEESMTDDKITGVSCKSPQPEPFKTSRSSRQRLKVSLVKAGMKEELLTAGKLTRTSGKTVQTHTEPTGGGKSIKAFKESPEQIVDPAASVTGSKRQLRTRKEKAHVLEDPGVFKELIPAPGHSEEFMTTDKNTKIPCKSPPPELADTAKNTKRCPRTRLKKEVKEELSAVQKLTKTSGQSAHTHTEPMSDGEGIKVVKQRAKKTPSPGVEEPSRRRPRAPKAKAQPLEDLAGFKELSETPGHTQESLTTGKAAKIPCKSPLLELADTRTSTKRHLRTHAQKVEVKEEPSAVGKFTQTSGEMADADKESVGKGKGIKTSKESAKQTLAPAACVTGSRRRPRAPRENAHALEDLAGFQDPAPGHPKESMTDDKTTKIPCKSLPEPVDTAISSKRRPRARAQKVEVKEEPLAAGQLTPASGETTHTDKEPAAGEGNGVKAFKQPAKQKLGPENVIGSRRRPRASKEKAQPPEDLASFQELSQTPGHTEELANGADSFIGTPKQTPDSGKPLKISRRVLRAPKVEPVRDQVGTRDLVKSQSKSNSSLPPPPRKRGCGKDGTVTGTKRLRFVPVPEEIVEELPASKKQRIPPRVRAKSPEPLVVMKRSLRISAKRSEPAEEVNSDSMNANKEEHKFQDPVPENKGMSLRARRQNKTDAEQPTTEVLILAGRMKINRNAKKPMKTSQEMDIQSPDDGAQKAVPRGKASENKRCLRSVRQNKSSQPKVAEESEGQKSTGILVQNQEGKGEAGNSDSVHLRSRKTKSQSAASTLESESVQRVTRGVKRCAENPKKAEDIICIKKIRTRSHQDSEDI
ncbi:proliferation marker protein Ki-67 isoform X1 [Cebus imitator]|uniref:Marker of proliferation Ki-67 n=1 Tax=Cebus imitator TaxID=2715852 RepID=A0A2K5RSS1_CEBIM|nr:proliferation marker protein Ki-67 isoform X1 [Cebus imitator]